MIENIETVPVMLDFTSSGQSLESVSALYADGLLLANALELTEFAGEAVQLLLCQDCGMAGCRSGGWVSLRRAGDLVLFIPAFRYMEAGEEDLGRYAPPDYISDRGLPCFNRPVYNRLIKTAPVFPEPADLAPLSVGEAIRLLQWTPPRGVLGRFPDPPRLAEDIILNLVDGEREKEMEKVRRFLSRYVGSPHPLVPVYPEPAFRRIEMLLDQPGYPSWTGFASDGELIYILLGDGKPYGAL